MTRPASSIPQVVIDHINGFFHPSRKPVIDRGASGQIGYWNWNRSEFIVHFKNDDEAMQCLRDPSSFYGKGNEDALGLGYFN